MSSSSPPPTFVLIPGACLSTSAFSPFLPYLQNPTADNKTTTTSNYEILTLQVPSADPTNPSHPSHPSNLLHLPPSSSSPSFPSDISSHTAVSDSASLRSQLLPLIESGKELILVPHSYAGIPTSAAAIGLSKSSRVNEGKKGGVLGIVFMAAMVIPEGEGVGTWLEPENRVGGRSSQWDEPAPGLTSINPSLLSTYIINDVEPNHPSIFHLQSACVPHAISALASEAPAQAWQSADFKGRLAYMKCTLDEVIPLAAQTSMVGRAEKLQMQGSGDEEAAKSSTNQEVQSTSWLVQELQAGHCPFASQPCETAECLVGFAKEFARV